MTKPPHILVIEDDREISALVARYLRSNDCRVTALADGRGVERVMDGHRVDLIVLDLMLPGEDGLSICKRLRTTSQVPIIMLTAKGDEVDRILGLEMGADDYLPKPFNPRELIARLRAIYRRTEESLQRAEAGATDALLCVGDLSLDPGTRNVRQAHRQVSMTAAEFSLLQELLSEAGRVVSREKLVEKVLGRKLAMFDRSIDVHVSSLRRKLGQESNGMERIKTIRGIGYMYVKLDG